MHGPESMVRQLLEVTNRHDLEGIVACFDDEYENATPVHPARSFRGREQVRRNWTQILGGIPDMEAEILDGRYDAETAWTEWEMRGTRPDGSPALMRGVMIFTVPGNLITGCRFYLEPVDPGTGTVDEHIRRQVTPA